MLSVGVIRNFEIWDKEKVFDIFRHEEKILSSDMRYFNERNPHRNLFGLGNKLQIIFFINDFVT